MVMDSIAYIFFVAYFEYHGHKTGRSIIIQFPLPVIIDKIIHHFIQNNKN